MTLRLGTRRACAPAARPATAAATPDSAASPNNGEYLRTRGRSTIGFVAILDGKVAGSASALLSDRGLFLIGGSTAPWARRRGVYRALVGARWRYAVERGTPALAVHAIRDTSSPILRRVGFREVCSMRRLVGRPT